LNLFRIRVSNIVPVYRFREVRLLFERFAELYSKLSPAARLFIPVGFILVIGLFIAMLALWKPVNMAPLFTDLTTADAGAIVEELKAASVDYRLADGGTTVLIPSEQVPEMRINLASKGMPNAGVVGFELFDKSKMGITETGMSIDYKRALEGELTRTLMGLNEVKAARVHLVLPKETSFLTEPEPSSASVVLHLESGSLLSEAQVQGIVHLIKHAVENLTEDNITVTDGLGNLLYGTSEDGRFSQEQLAYKRRVERDLETKVIKVLERAYGTDNVEAVATVDLDFTSIKKQSEEYTPVVGDQGIIKTETINETEKNGSSTGEGGVPGTYSNIPGYMGTTGGGNTEETESTSQVERNYEVNKQITETELAGGAILSRSISVVITDDKFDDVKRDEAEGLIIGAIGANITGGDKIFITGKPPRETAVAEGTLVKAVGGQRIDDYIRYALAAVIVIIALLIMRGIFNSIGPNLRLALEGADVSDEIPSLDFAMRAKEEGLDEDRIEISDIRRIREVPKTKHQQIKGEILSILKDNPQEVVRMIRNWLLED
jgi:flagellar M-ring protein FliF